MRRRGVLRVPDWTFLGATYDAVLVQPFVMASVGSPVNLQASGVHNTLIIPVELSWKLGDSRFFIKTGLGIYVPNATQTGINGLETVGNAWWTFQPELYVSYLKDGWNFTAAVFEEFNTKNTITQYRSGDVLHAKFVPQRRSETGRLDRLAITSVRFRRTPRSHFMEMRLT